MAISIEGMLRHYKGKKITFFQHDDGTPMTDREARHYIGQCLAKGWKLIPSTDECEGFDPFGKGCPGHPMPDVTPTKDEPLITPERGKNT